MAIELDQRFDVRPMWTRIPVKPPSIVTLQSCWEIHCEPRIVDKSIALVEKKNLDTL